MITSDLGSSLKAGISGLWNGAAVGSASGMISSYSYCKQHDINLWKGTKNNSTTIGQGMSRVKSAAQDLGSTTIAKDWPQTINPYHDGMLQSEAMDFNAYWIEQQMDASVTIYDIGTPNGGPVTSPFYNMEVGRTLNYTNVVNVKYIYYKTIIRILIIQ